ncbi:MAG: hypothetical protein KDC87_01175 [Planctomycetes bacterium]|nr:hypothetical protein [Planctomycetota bacterium]MCB9869298.1 hypothetical protein [Planctomycetota bacterium]
MTSIVAQVCRTPSWPWPVVLVWTLLGCHTAPAVPERLPSSLAALGRRAAGERIPLEHAVLFVPRGYRIPVDRPVPVHVHFQGGTVIAEENFVRMQRDGVLLASTLSGRSGAFAAPYRDPRKFVALLDSAGRALSQRAGQPVVLGELVITFFSAGYGAVRELLALPALFARIRALVSADSIYASVVAEGVRAPRAEQMVDFQRFAQAAARGEKTFVLAHGLYRTPYASTAECADSILAAVAARRVPVRAFTERGVPIAAEAHVGGFHLYTFAEATPGIHVDCLYMIPELVRRHVSAAQIP